MPRGCAENLLKQAPSGMIVNVWGVGYRLIDGPVGA